MLLRHANYGVESGISATDACKRSSLATAPARLARGVLVTACACFRRLLMQYRART